MRWLDSDDMEIKPSATTMENCYDVILVNEDYTIGNILNAEIYEIYFTDLKKVSYVGFKKMHPHDSNSILRISLVEANVGKEYVKQILKYTMTEVISNINQIKGLFDGTRVKASSMKASAADGGP